MIMNRPAWYHPRYYLHFDPKVSPSLAQQLVTNPSNVNQHSFYPFIEYHVESEKIYRDKLTETFHKKPKSRPIAYAAHLDSHIYSYYGYRLSMLYEDQIKKRGICSCVLASTSVVRARRIVSSSSTIHTRVRRYNNSFSRTTTYCYI